jgi:hypothetical protein
MLTPFCDAAVAKYIILYQHHSKGLKKFINGKMLISSVTNVIKAFLLEEDYGL